MKLSVKQRQKKHRFILTVGDDGAILIYMQGRRVLRRMFASSPSPEDVRHFDSLLATDPAASVTVLVDTMDQTYVQQNLPPVSPLTINKLIQRKLGRDFAASDLKAALPMGRSREGRKEWNYLFVAVAYVPPLSDWISFAVDRTNPFDGVYLLPVESEFFVRLLLKKTAGHKEKKPALSLPKLQRNTPKADAATADASSTAPLARWHILVSHNKVGGFRQIVFKEGKLIFTRMSQPVGEALPEVIAGNIEQELSNTAEYLKRLSFVPGDGLNVTVIVSGEIRAFLSPKHPNFRTIHMHTPHEVAGMIGVEKATEEGDHFGDVVFAAAFGASRTHKKSFTTPDIRQILQWHTIHRAIATTTQLLVPLFVCGILFLGWEAFDLNRNKAYVEERLVIAQQRLEEVQVKRKALPENIDEIVDTVSAYEWFEKSSMTPLAMIADFSTLLSDKMRVKNINWSFANTMPGAKRVYSAQTPRLESSFAVEFLGGDGTIDSFLAQIEQFNQQVKKTFVDYEVKFTSLPTLTSQEKGLEVNFANNGAVMQPTTPKDASITYTLTGPTATKNEVKP